MGAPPAAGLVGRGRRVSRGRLALVAVRRSAEVRHDADMTDAIVVLPCRAVLFDCDGVLVDSDAAVQHAWTRWAVSYRFDPAEVTSVVHGRRSADTVAMLVEPDARTEALATIDAVREIEDVDKVTAIPGALDLITTMPPAVWAVVTSGTTPLATARLKAAGLPVPAVLVTADDVENGKPAPDGYLAAAAALGVRPRVTVVLEDSASGVESARAAGVGAVVGVGDRALETDAGRRGARPSGAVLGTAPASQPLRRSAETRGWSPPSPPPSDTSHAIRHLRRPRASRRPSARGPRRTARGRRDRLGLVRLGVGRRPRRRLVGRRTSTQAACRAAPSATYSPGGGHEHRAAEDGGRDPAHRLGPARRRRPAGPARRPRPARAARRGRRRARTACPRPRPGPGAPASTVVSGEAVQRAGGVRPVRACARPRGRAPAPARRRPAGADSASSDSSSWSTPSSARGRVEHPGGVERARPAAGSGRWRRRSRRPMPDGSAAGDVGDGERPSRRCRSRRPRRRAGADAERGGRVVAGARPEQRAAGVPPGRARAARAPAGSAASRPKRAARAGRGRYVAGRRRPVAGAAGVAAVGDAASSRSPAPAQPPGQPVVRQADRGRRGRPRPARARRASAAWSR